MSTLGSISDFGGLYTRLYDVVLRVYGDLPVAVVCDLGRGLVGEFVSGGAVGESSESSSERLRLQVVHELASQSASYCARVAWGLGPRGDQAVVDGSVAGCSGGASGGEVGLVSFPGVACATVGRGDATVDTGAPSFPMNDCASTGEVSAKTLANRAKRHAKRRAKVERLAAERQVVPEWRRKDVRAAFHKGAFADCSDGVREELRETRARMLVERNKVAVVQAEQERRVLEARLKARLPEEEVEQRRLQVSREYERLALASRAGMTDGAVERLSSVEGLVPSLVSGSVSPSSSVSVAELKQRDLLLSAMTKRIAELEVVSDEYAAEKDEKLKQKKKGEEKLKRRKLREEAPIIGLF